MMITEKPAANLTTSRDFQREKEIEKRKKLEKKSRSMFFETYSLYSGPSKGLYPVIACISTFDSTDEMLLRHAFSCLGGVTGSFGDVSILFQGELFRHLGADQPLV